jgi:hypothetical protein
VWVAKKHNLLAVFWRAFSINFMNYKLFRISDNFYSFSVWDRDELLFVYTGKEKHILRSAEGLGYKIRGHIDDLIKEAA